MWLPHDRHSNRMLCVLSLSSRRRKRAGIEAYGIFIGSLAHPLISIMTQLAAGNITTAQSSCWVKNTNPLFQIWTRAIPVAFLFLLPQRHVLCTLHHDVLCPLQSCHSSAAAQRAAAAPAAAAAAAAIQQG
jgi:hypothetical protein